MNKKSAIIFTSAGIGLLLCIVLLTKCESSQPERIMPESEPGKLEAFDEAGHVVKETMKK